MRPDTRHPIPDTLRLLLLGIALAAAGCAQALASTRPYLSLVDFAAAALLAAVAVWERPPHAPAWRSAGTARPARVPMPFWIVFVAGVALCGIAALGVGDEARVASTHRAWLTGIVLLGASAFFTGQPSRWRRPSRGVLIAVAILLAACGGLFWWNLTALPPEVHGDDAEVGLDAIRLLEQRPFDLFRTGWFELPMFHALPTAVGLELFGADLLGLRATSAVLGTATVLLLFALAYRLWNLEVALLAALVLAASRFFIHLSRAGYHYVDTAFLSVCALWLLVAAWRDVRAGAAVWCGIVLGLGIQTYYASRLVPVLLVLTVALWIWQGDRALRRARLLRMALIVIAAVATAAPMIAYFSTHWHELWLRTSNTSMLTPKGFEHVAHGYATQDAVTIVWRQLQAALTVFNAAADSSVQYGYRRPMLDPFSAALFVVGVGVVAARWRDWRYRPLLLWILLPLIVGIALTLDAPFYPRVSGVLPFVALIIALGVHAVLTTVRAATPDPPARVLTLVIAVAVATIVLASNVQTYFFDYAPNYRHSPGVEIGRWVRQHGAGKTTYLVGGMPRFSIRHGSIRFQTWGLETRDIEDLGAYLREHRLDRATSLFVLMPAGMALLPQLEAAVGPLQVEGHENHRGQVWFTTAVPKTTGAALPAVTPPAPRQREAPVDPGSRRFAGRVTRAYVPSPPWLPPLVGGLSLCGIATAALLLWRSRRRPSRPWPRLTAPRWPSVLFGPHAREHPWQPSPRVTRVLLVLIIAVAAGLRLYRLGALPAGFYCDEAGLGYNAYSILQTGRDETGAFLPLYVWSFDTSYKNPLWLYSAVLPLSVLGLSESAVRLTSALYGIGTVVAMFCLGRALMGAAVGLLAALALAVCPWHLHFSRIAFELITFPFFFVLGMTVFVRSMNGRRWLPLAALCFGSCLYTYAVAKLFVPLFVAGLVAVHYETLRARWREALLAAAVLLAVAAPVVVFDSTNRERARHYFTDTTVLGSGAPALQQAAQIVANYATFFSPRFLFLHGDKVVRHAVRGHGELYPVFAPLLLIGVVVCLARRDRNLLLVVVWLLLYPLGPSLLTEIPSASRGIIGAPAFCLLSAIGAGAALRLAAQVTHRRGIAIGAQLALAGIGLAVLAPQVAAYWRSYADEYALYAAKFYTGFQYGHREVIAYFRAHQDEYDQMILTAHRSNQAHIFPLFFGPFPPERFQAGGQQTLQRDWKMQVGWVRDLDQYEQYPRLLFAVTEDELDELPAHEVKKTIIAPDGTPALVIADVFPAKQFVRSWLVAGPYPPDDASPPPVARDAGEPPEAPRGLPWRHLHPAGADVDLNDFFGHDTDDACAWALNVVDSPEQRAVTIRSGFDDRGEVWINGEPIRLQIQPQPQAPHVDPQVGHAQLRAGRNTVAVRTCEDYGDWFFYFHFTTAAGRPITDLTWEY